MATDLEGVKYKLTEGYERINRMKISASKLEACRAKLKDKETTTLVEVKTMMSNITLKLQQLQGSIENTIKHTVADRENQLDAKKKEIHDCYANLLKVCVEADNVLRGRNVEQLGRSCQHLFCKFEAANIRLDAAEKVDADRLIGFQLEDNSQQFLSNEYLARLQHFDRYGRLSEIDEFWVDYQSTDDLLDRMKETTYSSVSDSDCSGCSSVRPATVRRSPDRSTGFSPKQLLETIQEDPEDSINPYAEKANSYSYENPAPEVVRIREEDLCADIRHFQNGVIPPPPGFLKLKELRPEEGSIQKHLYCKNKAFNSDFQPSKKVQGDSADHLGYDPRKLSRLNACCGLGQLNGPSYAYQPASSYPAQSLDTSQNLRHRTPMSAEKHGNHDDFVWDSDDSLDSVNPKSSAETAPKKEAVNPKSSAVSAPKKEEDTGKLDSRICGKSFQMKPVVKAEKEKACLDLEYEGDILHYVPSISINCQQATGGHEDIVKDNLLQNSKLNGHHQKQEQMGNLERVTDMEQEVAQIDVKQEGHVVNLDIQRDIKQEVNGVDQKVQAVYKHKGGKVIPKDQIDIKQEADGVSQNEQSVKKQHVSDQKKEQPGLRQEGNIQKDEEEVSVREKGAVLVKATREADPVLKSVVKVVRDQQGALSRSPEIPHPLKTRRRLDLSRILQHIGGGHFVLNAKCIEKIRGDFSHPIGVCTNSKGDVIVADTFNHIVKVCKNGRVTSKFGEELKMRRPSAVAVNERDEIFVKDDYCLYHFDAEGQFIKTMGEKMMNTPYGLGMTKDGRLVVVDALYTKGRIHIFQQDGTQETFSYHPLQHQLEDSKCRFLAVHGSVVLTSDLGRSCLYMTNLRGELYHILGRRGKRCGELNEPAGVAVDSVGNWIVADSKNHRVQVFDPNGFFMAMVHFTGESIRRPSGIHLTSDGLLYIINYVDSIIRVFKLGFY